VAGLCLFLFYPGKMKAIGYTILWTILLAIMPLFTIAPQSLIWQYQNWLQLMIPDLSGSYGLSVQGMLYNWFGVGHAVTTAIALLLFVIPFLRSRLYGNEQYRLTMLSFMLVWMIIFNVKAESPTYIIAVSGIAIWYFSTQKRSLHHIVLGSVLLFTCLSTSDIFPAFIREHYFEPYFVKAIPCVAAWCFIFLHLLKMQYSQSAEV
jgi:hypothetical protein